MPPRHRPKREEDTKRGGNQDTKYAPKAPPSAPSAPVAPRPISEIDLKARADDEDEMHRVGVLSVLHGWPTFSLIPLELIRLIVTYTSHHSFPIGISQFNLEVAPYFAWTTDNCLSMDTERDRSEIDWFSKPHLVVVGKPDEILGKRKDGIDIPPRSAAITLSDGSGFEVSGGFVHLGRQRNDEVTQTQPGEYIIRCEYRDSCLCDVCRGASCLILTRVRVFLRDRESSDAAVTTSHYLIGDKRTDLYLRVHSLDANDDIILPMLEQRAFPLLPYLTREPFCIRVF